MEKLLWPKTFTLLSNDVKSGYESPLIQRWRGLHVWCVCVRCGGQDWHTFNAHIWNHLTSVLLSELNSFYRLEHILLDSGQEGGTARSLKENNPLLIQTLYSAALTCNAPFL